MTRHWCDHCKRETTQVGYLNTIRFQEILNRSGDLEFDLCVSCQDILVELLQDFKRIKTEAPTSSKPEGT